MASTFRVNLFQGKQGLLDRSVRNGHSIQRTVELAGPNGTLRTRLKDGDTFQDSNYFLRYCFPYVPLDQAMLEVVSDDGSFYSDYGPEAQFPRVYTLTVADGSSYTANVVNVLGDNGGPAVTTTIDVATSGVTVKLNDRPAAIYPIGNGERLSFGPGDLPITKLAFANASGTDATVTVLVSMKAVSNT